MPNIQPLNLAQVELQAKQAAGTDAGTQIELQQQRFDNMSKLLKSAISIKQNEQDLALRRSQDQKVNHFKQANLELAQKRERRLAQDSLRLNVNKGAESTTKVFADLRKRNPTAKQFEGFRSLFLTQFNRKHGTQLKTPEDYAKALEILGAEPSQIVAAQAALGEYQQSTIPDKKLVEAFAEKNHVLDESGNIVLATPGTPGADTPEALRVVKKQLQTFNTLSKETQRFFSGKNAALLNRKVTTPNTVWRPKEVLTSGFRISKTFYSDLLNSYVNSGRTPKERSARSKEGRTYDELLALHSRLSPGEKELVRYNLFFDSYDTMKDDVQDAYNAASKALPKKKQARGLTAPLLRRFDKFSSEPRDQDSPFLKLFRGWVIYHDDDIPLADVRSSSSGDQTMFNVGSGTGNTQQMKNDFNAASPGR